MCLNLKNSLISDWVRELMFDFNVDMAQGYSIYGNEDEFEIAKYASSVNISAGFHSGDPMKIKDAMLFVQQHNKALGVHIGYPDIQGFGKRKMNLSDNELEANVIYQVGAIATYAQTYDLEIENVRCHGAMKELLNEDANTAIVIARAVKKISPWLNLIVQNPQTKNIVEAEGLKAAIEFEFRENSSIREIRELPTKPDTIHFRTLADIKRAYEIIKPTPVNYNRVSEQI